MGLGFFSLGHRPVPAHQRLEGAEVEDKRLLQQLSLVVRGHDREQGGELVEAEPALGEGIRQQRQALESGRGLSPAARGIEAHAVARAQPLGHGSHPVALARVLSLVGRDHTKKLPQRGVVEAVQLVHGGAELIGVEAVVTRLSHEHHATGGLRQKRPRMQSLLDNSQTISPVACALPFPLSGAGCALPSRVRRLHLLLTCRRRQSRGSFAEALEPVVPYSWTYSEVGKVQAERASPNPLPAVDGQ